MALDITTPNVGVELQQLFGLRGSVSLGLEQFVIPTVSVGELGQSTPPSIRRRASAQFALGAVALERPTLRFEMIGGSLAVIRRMYFTTDQTGFLHIMHRGNAASIAALANTATKSFVDGRLLAGAPSGAQQPAGVLTFGTQVAEITDWNADIQFQSGVIFTYDEPGFVVGTGRPGLTGFLEIQVSIVNCVLRGALVWDEYTIP